jgi:hypothetical protein
MNVVTYGRINPWFRFRGLNPDNSQIAKVEITESQLAIKLVPLRLMKCNSNYLDRAAPRLCFYSGKLKTNHKQLYAKGTDASKVSVGFGKSNIAFSENELDWFPC